MSTILNDTVMDKLYDKSDKAFWKTLKRTKDRFNKGTSITKGGPGGAAASEMAQKRDIKELGRLADQGVKIRRFQRKKSSYVPFYEAD